MKYSKVSMLEYVKRILEKVSFDSDLFKKELSKGIKLLSKREEIPVLYAWCILHFSQYHEAIQEVFNQYNT